MRRTVSVALVGADGAGKSTISELLHQRSLPAPVKDIYMGVNLQASRLMLPTTRLALVLKRARGGRPDMTADSGREVTRQAPSRPAFRRCLGAGFRGLKMLLWMAEEWYRQLVAFGYQMRGFIVIYDRHFYADYYHHDVTGRSGVRPVSARVHGFLLRHAYPKPNLVICLDAPGAVLYERKSEASPEWLEQRRQQYLALAEVVPHFRIVDVDRPLDHVVGEVAEVISEFWGKRQS